jgi:DNA-binding transcriptional regulator YiaG
MREQSKINHLTERWKFYVRKCEIAETIAEKESYFEKIKKTVMRIHELRLLKDLNKLYNMRIKELRKLENNGND